ncbi:DNA damage-regulated autophagy modulator protein 1 [Trichonephila clavipes]|uniref:DNA damage-regulated autophagy modulator protein 1 n=1 Tax=Trichonephila clavipes TaxID=2585209 RepID=A0A8X6SBP0_TRICX|nr:DNA damage-regulated autophagy modulator protein 1 [Trichonephila clavipes]
MAKHCWSQLPRILFLFGLMYTLALFLPLIIAVSNERVTPYVPYISEGGGHFPEAGIFGFLLSICALLSQMIICLRYLVVEGSHVSRTNEMYAFLNTVALVLGSMSTFSLVVVLSHPTTTSTQVHNTAAGMTCICFYLYMFCHTWITLLLSECHRIRKIRLIITITSFIALVIIAVFGVLGSVHWTSARWVGTKTPGDETALNEGRMEFSFGDTPAASGLKEVLLIKKNY